MIFMIAVIKEEEDIKNTMGFRLIDTDTKEIRQVSYQEVLSGMQWWAVTPENLKVDGKRLKGYNGTLNRYPILNEKLQLIGKSPAIILYKTDTGEFVCSDFKGNIAKMDEKTLIKYAKQNGIANGKIVVGHINAIEGHYKIILSEETKLKENEKIQRHKAKSTMLGVNNLNIIMTEEGAVVNQAKSGFNKYLIPNNVIKIEDEVFQHSTLTELIIHEGLKTIGNKALKYCKQLKYVKLPSSVENIGYDAFNGCKSIENIALPPKLQVIQAGTFAHCESLREIIIHPGINEICPSAFYECNSITKISIPGSVKVIGAGCFEECKSLRTVVISEGTKKVDNFAFSLCTELENIEIPDSVTSIGYRAFSETGLKTIKLPKRLKKISGNTFNSCTKLEEIGIPDTVEIIDSKAFSDCTSLRILKLPNSINKIAPDAFLGCKNLKEILAPEHICEKIKNIVPDAKIVSY